MHTCKKGYIDILFLETKDVHCLIWDIILVAITEKIYRKKLEFLFQNESGSLVN